MGFLVSRYDPTRNPVHKTMGWCLSFGSIMIIMTRLHHGHHTTVWSRSGLFMHRAKRSNSISSKVSIYPTCNWRFRNRIVARPSTLSGNRRDARTGRCAAPLGRALASRPALFGSRLKTSIDIKKRKMSVTMTLTVAFIARTFGIFDDNNRTIGVGEE
jgi:hypothetical protein